MAVEGNKINYITPQGLKKIQDELHHLLHIDRPEVVKTVSWAAANGDRSENADYIYGKRRLREIDRRIGFLTGRLDNIEVIDPKAVATDLDTAAKVQFGATVTITDENGKCATYQIVGADEIDAAGGLISWESPLARALIGRVVGDLVTVRRPAGEIEVEVIKIEYK